MSLSIASERVFVCNGFSDDEGDSDSDYEIITVDPNINYESEDDEAEHVEMTAQPIAEVKQDSAMCIDKTDEASCDSVISLVDEDVSMDPVDLKSQTKVRKKLNLQEYKMRRANEVEKPHFDPPRKVAAYELCNVPSLPNLVLPTDFKAVIKTEIKSELLSDRIRTSEPAFNPDHYEEIILVSMGCNTDVSIPPFEEQEEKPTSKFLTNIVNNLKNQNEESLLNSSTTLFSSIQAVVQGKCQSTGTDHRPTVDSSKDSKEHGEDKTIMHLRKDRLRPFRCSNAVQTDNDSLFPPLLLSPALIFNRIRNAKNYRRKMSRSRSRSRSFSPDYDRLKYHNNANNSRYSRSQHSTHSSSMNSSSSSSSDSDSDSDSHSCSSSQSSEDSLQRFNNRQNFRFYNRNQTDRQYNYQGEYRRLTLFCRFTDETFSIRRRT